MSTTTQPRQPNGVPAGGQWKAAAGSAPSSSLVPQRSDDWGAVLDYTNRAARGACRKFGCYDDNTAADIAAAVVTTLYTRESKNPGWLAQVAEPHGTLAHYIATAVNNRTITALSRGSGRMEKASAFEEGEPGAHAVIDVDEAFHVDVEYTGENGDRWRAWADFANAPWASTETVHHGAATEYRKTMERLGGVLAACNAWRNETLSDDDTEALFSPWRKLVVTEMGDIPESHVYAVLAKQDRDGTRFGRLAAAAYRADVATPGQLTYLFGGYGVGRSNGRTQKSEMPGFDDQERIIGALTILDSDRAESAWNAALAYAAPHSIRRQKD